MDLLPLLERLRGLSWCARVPSDPCYEHLRSLLNEAADSIDSLTTANAEQAKELTRLQAVVGATQKALLPVMDWYGIEPCEQNGDLSDRLAKVAASAAHDLQADQKETVALRAVVKRVATEGQQYETPHGVAILISRALWMKAAEAVKGA